MTEPTGEPKRKPTYSDPVSEAEYRRVRDARRELEQSQPEKRDGLKPLRQGEGPGQSWMKYSALGLQMAAALVIPVLLGLWADSEWGWAPWGVILGGVLGTFAGITSVIMIVTREEKRESKAGR